MRVSTAATHAAAAASKLKPLPAGQPIKPSDDELKAFEADKAATQRFRDEEPMRRAQSMAVKAHTVFRQEGRIVAVQWQDGSTEFHDSRLAGRVDMDALVGRETAQGLTRSESAEGRARAMREAFGTNIRAESWVGRDTAPTRQVILQERYRQLGLSWPLSLEV